MSADAAAAVAAAVRPAAAVVPLVDAAAVRVRDVVVQAAVAALRRVAIRNRGRRQE